MTTQPLRNVLFSLVACVSLGAAPVASAAGYVEDKPSPEAMIFDGLIVRPLGLAATVVGTAGWIVTLPFSLLGRNAGDAARAMIVEPAAFTFTRPLGEL